MHQLQQVESTAMLDANKVQYLLAMFAYNDLDLRIGQYLKKFAQHTKFHRDKYNIMVQTE